MDTRNDYRIDDAVELAARRTAEAQHHFVAVPPVVREALARVVVVERRAEDLAVLTDEAEHEVMESPPRATGPGEDVAPRERRQ
jgi:hypothetical protein